jgi:amino acid adenylation domain-containing protein
MTEYSSSRSAADAPRYQENPGESQRRQQLHEWNQTRREYGQECCIHELFEAQARRTPDRVALVQEGCELSYEELELRADALARRLIDRGVGPEVRVGVCLPRSMEMVIGILGILKAGGCYVPLDPDYPGKRLEQLIKDAQLELIVTEAAVASRVSGAGRELLWVEDQSGPQDLAPVAASRDRGLRPEHPAYLIYTSASTGTPKGVLGLHRSIVNRVNWLGGSLVASDVLCQKTSLGFVDHVAEIFQALSAGVPLLIVNTQMLLSPKAWLRELDSRRVTHLTLVPSLLRAVLQESQGESARWLKWIHSSGEALHLSGLQGMAECFPRAQLRNVYGSTEMGADVTSQALSVQEAQGGQWAPIGKGIDNTQVYVLDAHGQLVLPGTSGELYVGGVCLARGYFARAGLTAEKFVPHPFGEPGERLYRSGDLARWRTDGTLEYLGRLDSQVKVRGHRIELAEIESVLLGHEAVREAAVVAREQGGDLRLVGYVVGRCGESKPLPAALIEQLRAALSEQLPKYMVPAAFVVLESLPLTATGKLDRKALPEPQESLSGPGYAAPEGATEQLLAQIWCSLLKRDRVGRHDNFFELGGHSLLATQLASRTRARFLVDLPIRELFDKRTLQEQALAIDGHREAGAGDVDVQPNALYREFEKARTALAVAGHALEAGEI